MCVLRALSVPNCLPHSSQVCGLESRCTVILCSVSCDGRGNRTRQMLHSYGRPSTSCDSMCRCSAVRMRYPRLQIVHTYGIVVSAPCASWWCFFREISLVNRSSQYRQWWLVRSSLTCTVDATAGDGGGAGDAGVAGDAGGMWSTVDEEGDDEGDGEATGVAKCSGPCGPTITPRLRYCRNVVVESGSDCSGDGIVMCCEYTMGCGDGTETMVDGGVNTVGGACSVCSSSNCSLAWLWPEVPVTGWRQVLDRNQFGSYKMLGVIFFLFFFFFVMN